MFHPDAKSSGKIVVIDDDPGVGRLIEKLLKKVGHSVEIFTNGEEAIRHIEKEKCDIVVTDIKLPGMDGMTVLGKIREISLDIDAIVITGFGSIESAVSFMKAGALDYISKPINNEHLEIIIQKAIERKELIKAARERDIYMKLSLTDALTGLFNHKYFQDQLERELFQSQRAGQELALILLDIDNFKRVNDQYGHQAGDRVLQRISTNLINACRCHDTIARYGGEEFAIILPETHPEQASAVAKRILGNVSTSTFPSVKHTITVSIGISGYPIHSYEKDDLIKKADRALYNSKANGKNRFSIFHRQMNNQPS